MSGCMVGSPSGAAKQIGPAGDYQLAWTDFRCPGGTEDFSGSGGCSDSEVDLVLDLKGRVMLKASRIGLVRMVTIL